MKKFLLAFSLIGILVQLSAQDVIHYMEDFDGGPNGWTVNTYLCEGTTGGNVGTYTLSEGTYNGQAISDLSAELSIYTELEYTLSFDDGTNSGYSQAQFVVDNGDFLSTLTGADFDLEGTIDSLQEDGRILFTSQLNITQELFDQWGITLTGAGSPSFELNGDDLTLTSADDLTVLKFTKTSDCGQAWIWHPTGEVGYGALAGVGLGLLSETNDNGTMSINADWLSTLGNINNLPETAPFPNYESELISPSIDLSDVTDTAYLKFTEFMIYFIFGSPNAPSDQFGLDLSASVSYSIDGGENWIDSIDVNPDVKFRELVEGDDRLIKLPQAAGNSDVKIKFNWTGQLWYWVLDDIMIMGKPEYDLALGDFTFYPPASYQQPVTQIASDTMFFFANVSNQGTKDATNVRLRAFVFDPSANLIYEDSLFIDNLPAGYTDSLMILPGEFVPDMVDQVDSEYTILYGLAADSSDVNFSDNIKFFEFVADEDTYAKEDGDGLFGFNWTSDFQVGCYYLFSPLAGDGWVATKATFSAFSNQAPPANAATTTLLYKVKDEVRSDFGDFDFTSKGEEDDLEVVGFGTYQFGNDFSFIDDAEVTIGDIDLNPVPLEPGGRYFLANNYEGGSRVIAHVYDNDIRYFQTSAIAFVEGRWFFGFGAGPEDSPRNQPVMRMTIDLANPVDKTPLPEASMNIFPNPTTEYLSLDLDLEKSSEALVIITSAEGKVLKWQEYDNVQKETLTFDVSSYPAGSYFIRLGTEEGTRTLPFVVTRQ